LKNIEQILKALNNRIDRLEEYNDQIVKLAENSNNDIMHLFFENEARISELIALLDYINEGKEIE